MVETQGRTKLSPAYAAGLFDTTLGTIGGLRTTLEVALETSNGELAAAFYDTFGGDAVYLSDRKPPIWRWVIRGWHAIAFLELIQPHSLVKATQVRFALDIAKRGKP